MDIAAFDQAPLDGERTNRYHSRTRPWTHVEQGDQIVLSGYADRGLFLCWPPLFSSLGDCPRPFQDHDVSPRMVNGRSM